MFLLTGSLLGGRVGVSASASCCTAATFVVSLGAFLLVLFSLTLCAMAPLLGSLEQDRRKYRCRGYAIVPLQFQQLQKKCSSFTLTFSELSPFYFQRRPVPHTLSPLRSPHYRSAPCVCPPPLVKCSSHPPNTSHLFAQNILPSLSLLKEGFLGDFTLTGGEWGEIFLSPRRMCSSLR